MSVVSNSADPRVKRTRQLLLQAFMALLKEKRNIHSISVQEIAARATVNRATFYAHFDDKYALLDAWMREKFRRSISSQLAATSTLQRHTLYSLILDVFRFLALFRDYIRPADKQFEPFFEVAVQQELCEVLLIWLKRAADEIPITEETIKTTAMVISWTIFGPAAQWSREPRTIPLEEMAQHVLTLVMAALSPVITIT
ncbi:TetR/AcrR family transcriptional regulator [Ktedonosporobacter rubrisoli]|uniref:TetR/AcrR family transcriptional regulator n=1 Tax=Ktedonosporobacter rubrisoli TaxID=2509675 RepID=A0A4P6JJL5_KTERU|nr:TetR/AcrR family transcriptional regulator [Ktedonosporobacter rubrisoli]QBD75314.1 TetR/AcrR family transcriptional regulator [Ktedonosporobacter rubrisoli]